MLVGINIDDLTVNERDGSANFRVWLNGRLPGTTSVSVTYATVSGSAIGGVDFDHKGARITFGEFENEKLISVPIRNDSLSEGTENFFVRLSMPSAQGELALINRLEARGNIVDDESAGTTINVADALTALEGFTSSFRVSLSGPVTGAVTFSYTTENGTATSPDDFIAKASIITLTAGNPTADINIALVDDAIDEPSPDETFRVRLFGAVNGTIGREVGHGTIRDNDEPNTRPAAAPGGPYSINEGDPLTLDGSQSIDPDPGDTITSYQWFLGGSATPFSTGATPIATWATLVAHGVNNDGAFTLRLVVRDNHNGENTRTTELAVLNVAPLVDAGDNRTVIAPGSIALSAVASDKSLFDQERLTYAWRLTDSSGVEVGTGNAAATAFRPTKNDTFVATVTVSDDDTTTTDSIVIIVDARFAIPVAVGTTDYERRHIYGGALSGGSYYRLTSVPRGVRLLDEAGRYVTEQLISANDSIGTLTFDGLSAGTYQFVAFSHTNGLSDNRFLSDATTITVGFNNPIESTLPLVIRASREELNLATWSITADEVIHGLLNLDDSITLLTAALGGALTLPSFLASFVAKNIAQELVLWLYQRGVDDLGNYQILVDQKLIRTWDPKTGDVIQDREFDCSLIFGQADLVRQFKLRPADTITIHAHSPVSLVIEDINGRRAGVNAGSPGGSISYNDLAHTYATEGETTTLFLRRGAISPSYRLYVHGTGAGTYTLDVEISKSDYSQTIHVNSRPTIEGALDVFEIFVPATSDAAPRIGSGSVSGEVFNDVNGNAVREETEGGLAGRTIFVDVNRNGRLDLPDLTTTTDSMGGYGFVGLTPGHYEIRQLVPSGWTPTFPASGVHSLEIPSEGQTNATGKNFASVALAVLGSVYHDRNANGIKEILTDAALLRTLKPSGADNAYFGSSIATDGRRVAIGAHGLNRVDIYDDYGATFVRTIHVPGPRSGNFGSAVALKGNRLLVGAPDRHAFEDVQPGEAYLYDLSQPTEAPLLTLQNPYPAAGGFFGQSVSFLGDDLLVGALYHNTDAQRAGRAYLLSGATGGLINVFENPGAATANDLFGGALAAIGRHAFIGAPNATRDDVDSGAVYLYDIGQSTVLGDEVLTRVFQIPTPSAGDLFGYTVTTLGHDYVAIAAVNDDFGAENAGAVYLFEVSSGKLIRRIANPFPNIGDQFGISIAAVGSDKLFIGAWGDDEKGTSTGAAYLIDAFTGDLLQTVFDPAPNQNDLFGSTVAASGDKLIVSSSADGGNDHGSVWVFQRSIDSAAAGLGVEAIRMGGLTKTLAPTRETQRYYGTSLATDRSRLAVGAHGWNVVDVYDSATLTLARSYSVPVPATANFGSSVDIQGDLVLIGAPARHPLGDQYVGEAYVYDLSNPGDAPIFTLASPAPFADAKMGNSVAIANGDFLVGATLDDQDGVRSGRAYLFSGTTGQLLHTFVNPNANPAHDEFGGHVAAFGDCVLISAPNADRNGQEDVGAVYLYDLGDRAVTGDEKLLHTFVHPSPQFGSGFGVRVAALGDTHVAISAYAEGAGAVYVFDVATGELVNRISNPFPANGELFGDDLAAVGNDELLIGAWRDSGSAARAGAAYLVNAFTGEVLQILENPEPDVDDYFGSSVAATANKLIVGAPLDGNNDYGSVYVFDADSGPPRKAVTDASGNFTISNVPAGSYLVRTLDAGGWLATSPAIRRVQVAAGLATNAGEFGAFQVANTATIPAVEARNDGLATGVIRQVAQLFNVDSASWTLRTIADGTSSTVGIDAGQFIASSDGSGVTFSVATFPLSYLRSGKYDLALRANAASSSRTYQDTEAILVHSGLSGDYDADRDVDGTDFLLWQRNVGAGVDLSSDGNRDGLVNRPDLTVWSQNYGRTLLQGDFNSDGSVSGSDFLIWQRTLGSRTHRAADGGGNGMVEGADLTIWRNTFGSQHVASALTYSQWSASSPLETSIAVFSSPRSDHLLSPGAPPAYEIAGLGLRALNSLPDGVQRLERPNRVRDEVFSKIYLSHNPIPCPRFAPRQRTQIVVDTDFVNSEFVKSVDEAFALPADGLGWSRSNDHRAPSIGPLIRCLVQSRGLANGDSPSC